ncbi:hypothetical protein ABXS71_16715 [Bacillus infantis]|uniref:hypothetical protein n=1 Tax=Bacillus infantis TaxID=324767 RepID=UPI00345094F1
MKKIQSMSVREFMSRPASVDNHPSKISRHLEKYGPVYRIAGSSIIFLMAGGGISTLAAGSVIDAKANVIYYKLVDIGKWIIIFKGAMDTIKAAGNGDFDGAKKSFFAYLLVYLLLLGLPYGFNEIDKLFSDIKAV